MDPNKTLIPPKTCREAALRLYEWADKTPHESDMHRTTAKAEVLEAFGDVPLPEALLADIDWSRV